MRDLVERALLHPWASLAALWNQWTVEVWLRAAWLIAFAILATIIVGLLGWTRFLSDEDPEVPPTERDPLPSPDPCPSLEPWPKRKV